MSNQTFYAFSQKQEVMLAENRNADKRRRLPGTELCAAVLPNRFISALEKMLKFHGIRDGYRSLIEGDLEKCPLPIFLNPDTGGTILGTSRQSFKTMYPNGRI